MKHVITDNLVHIPENVQTFSPESSSITTTSGRTISYESLIVATGLQINWNNIPGLSQALIDASSGVSSIYSYETCDKVWRDIDALRGGHAVFTQPAGVVKCAGGMSDQIQTPPPRLLTLILHSSSKDYVDGLGQVSANWTQGYNQS